MLEYFRCVFDKNIYKVKLYMIKNDNNGDLRLTRQENLQNMQSEFVEEILVRKTASDNYVKELITGILIPVKKEYLDSNDKIISAYKNYRCCNNLKSPVFIRNGFNSLSEAYFVSGSWEYFRPISNCIADDDNIEFYTLSHYDVIEWRRILNSYFIEGEKRYKDSFAFYRKKVKKLKNTS